MIWIVLLNRKILCLGLNVGPDWELGLLSCRFCTAVGLLFGTMQEMSSWEAHARKIS